MQHYIPGDLVRWHTAGTQQWRHDTWVVMAYVATRLHPTKGEEQFYRIAPEQLRHRPAMHHEVGSTQLTRRTDNDHAFEPGEHVIYQPAPDRLRMEDSAAQTLVREQWIGTIQSSYASAIAPGDIIVRFAARAPLTASSDWNMLRWRQDFRYATRDEIRNARRPFAERNGQTVTDVIREQMRNRLDAHVHNPTERAALEVLTRSLSQQPSVIGMDFATERDLTATARIYRGGMVNGDVTEFTHAGERLFRARDGQCFTTLEGAMNHNRIVDEISVSRETQTLKPVAPPEPKLIGGKRKIKI